MNLSSMLLASRCLVAVGLLTESVALAQPTSPNSTAIVAVTVSPADASVGAVSYYRAKGLLGQQDPPAKLPANARHGQGNGFSANGTFFPADLSNPGNGAPIVTAQQHPVYINMPPSHWGDPARFLIDLGASEFVHVIDQYVGNGANNRYTLGTQFSASVPPTTRSLMDSNLYGLLHALGKTKGSGLGHIYHIFLPQGMDECLSAGVCYSPDNPSTFNFCAYHSAVVFSDSVGEVIYTVEPYQNVLGCSAPPTGTPNGQLADSTNSTLSHEVFEAITDPGLDAWWVQAYTFAYGNEVADLCTRAAAYPGGNVYSADGTVNLNGRLYAIQSEYSNKLHGCTLNSNNGNDN